MYNSPYNCLTSSFVLLLQYPATHIGKNIFLSIFLSQITQILGSDPAFLVPPAHTTTMASALGHKFLRNIGGNELVSLRENSTLGLFQKKK